MDQGNKKHLPIAICLLLALVTLLLYWPIRHDGFISLDDHAYVTENLHVRSGLTWSGIVWAFRTGYLANWHPLTWIFYMLGCQLYGVNAGGYHLTSLLFHIANTLLLFLLLRQMTGVLWRSAFVATLFAWHPLHIESVAWASELKDVLSTFFWMLTLVSYVWYTRKPSRAKYGLTLGLFALGLMSKPMVVTLPCVLLLIDFWPLKRLNLDGWFARLKIAKPSETKDSKAKSDAAHAQKSFSSLIIEKLPFFFLTTAACVVTYMAQKGSGAVSSLVATPMHDRIINALLVYWRYISKTFWPTNLAIIYPYPRHLSLLLGLGAGLLLVLWSGLFLWQRKRHPYLLVGWLWYLGTLVPTIGLVQVGSQSMADRYMYIPSVGIFILVAWGLNDLLTGWRLKVEALTAAGLLSLALCVICTRHQITYWKDGITLFSHAIKITSHNYAAYDGLGKSLDDAGRPDEAISCFTESVKMEPDSSESQYNLGTALMDKGEMSEAVKHLTHAVKLKPDFAWAQENLGNALLKQGKLDQAAAHLTQAVQLTPDDPEVHYNLGTVYLAQSRLAEATFQFQQALKLKPDYESAQANLAVALIQQGKVDEAVPHFAEAARLDPKGPSAHFNFGLALLQQNKPESAAEQFSQVLQLSPDNAAAHYRLAVALSKEHKAKAAIAHYKEAIRLNPDFPDALNELSWILSSAPDPEVRNGKEAIQLAEQACKLTKREQAGIVLTLANAFAESGQYSKALSTAQEAHDLAASKGENEIAAKAEKLQKLYKTSHPFHETF